MHIIHDTDRQDKTQIQVVLYVHIYFCKFVYERTHTERERKREREVTDGGSTFGIFWKGS